MADMPSPPTPKIATVSPSFTLPLRNAWNAVSRLDCRYLRTNPFHFSGDFMSQCDRQHAHAGPPRTVMCIRMTDSRGAHAHENTFVTSRRDRDMLQL